MCFHFFRKQLVQNTMNRTRIYVFLGAANSLVDFMSSMETAGLFARGEYMVIFVDMMVYSERYLILGRHLFVQRFKNCFLNCSFCREAEKYLRRVDQITFMSNCHSTENFNQMARSLLVVASTPPTKDYIQFTKQVQKYSSKPPFNLEIPRLFVESNFSKVCAL